MNQKRAKLLRKQARDLTVGLPLVRYIGGAPPLFKPMLGAGKTVIDYVKIASGTPTTLEEGCTRYSYKKLKRIDKESKI